VRSLAALGGEQPRRIGLDAFLYGASAAFALQTLGSAYARSRAWGAFGLPAYGSGAVASVILVACGGRLAPRRLEVARVLLAAFVLVGAVVLPLAAEVQWRAQRGPQYVTSEVVVTERAGAALARWRDPYSAPLDSVELARSPKAVGHFPYLPAMALFGFPRAFLPQAAWTDVRLFFAIATALAAAGTLCCWPGPRADRLRALQILVVLPTGATATVVGGDDVPVLALSLLALVLFQRGHRAASAGVVALAALLKLTAWPLMFALAVVGRKTGRRLPSPLVVAPIGVLFVVLAAARASPAGFADDVILFPQGLSSLPSPAASTTIGSLVVAAVSARRVATWALLGLALLVSAALLARLAREPAPPPRAAASAAAAILLTFVLLAPVARSGYFVYPVELLIWGALLSDPTMPAPHLDRASAPTPAAQELAP
jgi:Glycosyltransferase family 87